MQRGDLIIGRIGLAVDEAGTAYLSVGGRAEVYRNIGTQGFTLLAGPSDGLVEPLSPVVDSAGVLYVRDQGIVRRIGSDGKPDVVAGQPGLVGNRLGQLPGTLSRNAFSSSGAPFEPMALGPADVLYLTADNALLKIRLK